MSLFKKPIKFPEEEEISRGNPKTWDNRVDGSCIEMIRGACNSITHRPLLSDQEILQVKSGLSLQGKKRILLTIVLDCSMSTGDAVYRSMYDGIAQLAGIMAKTDSMRSADISIITVEQSKIMMRQDYAPCTADIEIPSDWKCGKGLSPIVCAAYIAYKRGLRRRDNYTLGRINCYRPLTVLISDFKNNDNRYQGITTAGIEEMLQEMNDSQDSDILKVCTQQGNPLYDQIQGAELPFVIDEQNESEKINEWFHDLYLMLRQMFRSQDHSATKQQEESPELDEAAVSVETYGREELSEVIASPEPSEQAESNDSVEEE